MTPEYAQDVACRRCDKTYADHQWGERGTPPPGCQDFAPPLTVEEIAARAAAATPGPWRIGWESCDCGGGYPCGHGSYPYAICGPKRTDPSLNFPDYNNQVSEIVELTDEDATFIAEARTDVDWLTARVRELEAMRQRVLDLAALFDENWEAALSGHDDDCVGAVIRAAVESDRSS